MGAKKTFFRADHRDLKPGDPILPGDDYIAGLSANHRAVEDLIRASLSDGAAIRGATVHVFEDANVAKNYWLPWAMKGRHLYEVEVDTDDIRYRGDMALYNTAADDPADEVKMRRLVAEYCSGKESPNSMIKVMADKAVVKRQLHTAAEGKRLFRDKHFPNRNANPDIDEIATAWPGWTRPATAAPNPNTR
jgi:hypothetical protein